MPWADAAGQRWGSPDAGLLDVREVFADSGGDPNAAPAKCAMLGEVMLAVMSTDEDGLVRSLQIALSDPAAAARIGAANGKLMIEGPAAAGGSLGIKLQGPNPGG